MSITPNTPPDDRPVPFLLRLATWRPHEERPAPEDGAIFFRQRATLTGQLLVTERGGDATCSDLAVAR